MIQIFSKGNAFIFRIWRKQWEDFYDQCFIYWTPINAGTTSFFDTKEKAIEAAFVIMRGGTPSLPASERL
jgi:hypothetical protein